MFRMLMITRKCFTFMPVFAFIVFTLPAPAQKNRQRFTPIDTAAIERIIGMKGKSNNGEYKITVPQNDLSINVDGFKIVPAMGLGTWIAFTPSKQGAMIMGDIVV
ncbi:MAG TPA: DUF1259 domain-containing protein, partial [Chitinophagaceae bacterium]|nr:DUF1259 domain-containing protein [Chitinophagaceae bacterium]